MSRPNLNLLLYMYVGASDEIKVPSRLGRLKAERPPEYELALLTQNLAEKHHSWDTKKPAHEWEGVTCDEHGQVVRIWWAFRGLRNTLGWEHFPSTLVEFGVEPNRLCGAVSWGSLSSSLVHFLLQNNNFSGKIDL